MKAIEQYFQVVLFVFDNFAKRFFLSFELSTLGSERVKRFETVPLTVKIILICRVLLFPFFTCHRENMGIYLPVPK